jgi:hypothetical protein
VSEGDKKERAVTKKEKNKIPKKCSYEINQGKTVQVK